MNHHGERAPNNSDLSSVFDAKKSGDGRDQTHKNQSKIQQKKRTAAKENGKHNN